MLAFKSKKTLSSSVNKREDFKRALTILKSRLKPRRKVALLRPRPKAKKKWKPCLDTTMKYQNSKSSKSKSETNTLAKKLEWRRESESKLESTKVPQLLTRSPNTTTTQITIEGAYKTSVLSNILTRLNN